MSLYKAYYVIAGYDLTAYITDKYSDWKWTDEGERYLCTQRNGNIQLFDDPCNGDHTYLGYILACGDQYEFNTTVININEFSRQMPYVLNKLKYLVDIGIVDKNIFMDIRYNMIAFEETR
jgi:hypothetical protein